MSSGYRSMWLHGVKFADHRPTKVSKFTAHNDFSQPVQRQVLSLSRQGGIKDLIKGTKLHFFGYILWMIHERNSSIDVETNPVETSKAPVAKSLSLKQDIQEAMQPQVDKSERQRRNCSAWHIGTKSLSWWHQSMAWRGVNPAKSPSDSPQNPPEMNR